MNWSKTHYSKSGKSGRGHAICNTKGYASCSNNWEHVDCQNCRKQMPLRKMGLKDKD